ncbi:MAG TPA: putative metal-dependent hydrolase [Chryseolinea sp.]|nr:putative metal-dependent hydrolase [Chryseolinea sp.]
MNNDDLLRYPIGKFTARDSYSTEELQRCIERIENLPREIEKVINAMTIKQLDTPYREGGWTARQVVHHMADSHMNAYIRLKWSLTESTPTIKAYDEKAWAETPETKLDPVISIDLLKALHIKWTALLRRLSPADFQKEFIHPETKKHMRLDRITAMYAWHGEHHFGHLKIVANRS